MRIDTQATLARRVARWRESNLTIGWTNGVFDLLHLGHVGMLVHAKAHCWRLIVGISDDAAVRALKGPGRPIYSANERARMVAALKPVDAVIVFSEDMLDPLIAGIAPDVLFKGADWKGKTIVGAEHVDRVEFVPLVNRISTTQLIERIACTSSPEAQASSARPSSARSGAAASARLRPSTGAGPTSTVSASSTR
jgi:D-beta-D-heptose 7-phosphate kinase/D-beta-D-heptose 1-phosphate adenosyltransferase